MVELSRTPCDVAVTECTVLREIAADMIRVADPFKILPVAPDTIAGEIEPVFYMTVGTGYCQMCASNFESGSGHVVERDTLPGDIAVTGLAIRRESQGAMIWVAGLHEITFMAAVAEMRRSGIGFRMAFEAIGAEMRSPDLEFAGMLKRCIPPVRRYGGMACLAVGGEPGQDMIGILSGCEIVLMAALAIQGSTREFLSPLLDMTGLAIDNGMYSHQGETSRGVSLEQILPVLPAVRGMAILAFYAELASVDVGMTIGTFHTDMGEFQILVAAKAINSLVISDQRETRLGVIELQRFLKSLPGTGGMTLLTIPIDIAVGVRHRFLASC